MHRRRAGKITAAALLGAVVVIAGYFAFRYLNVDAARELVVQRLETITGREVVIEGDFDLVPSLAPTLAAEGIVVANAEWASEAAMLDADRIEVELQLIPLLWRGDLVIDRLVVSGADLALETGVDGRANWRFEPTVPEEEERERGQFLLNDVVIQDSRLRWRGPGTEETETVAVERLAWQAPTLTSAIALSASGQVRGQSVELSGELGSFAELFAEQGSYPVSLEGTVGPMSARVAGEVSLADHALELAVAVSGEQLARLSGLVGTVLPELGAYEFQGTLTGSTEALALVDVSGELGAEGAPELRISGGTVADVLSGEGVLAEVKAEGSELADLAAALGIEMARFGPFAAGGTLEGSFASLALRRAEATAGDPATRLSLAGAIGELFALQDLDLAATVQGSDLAGLSPLAGFALPQSELYRIAGRITGSIDDLRIDDLEAEIAESRVGGSLAVRRFAAERPRIEGELVAERLDVDALLALAEGEPKAAAPAAEVAPEPLPLAWLDEFDAEIAVRGDALLLGKSGFEEASFSLVLQQGRLGVQDLVLQVAGGSVAGEAALEAQGEGDLAQVTVRLNAHDVDLGEVLTDWTASEKIGGEIDIDISLDATGRSLDELLATVEGSAAVVGEEGQIKDAPLDLLVTDLDILRALPPFWQGDDDDVRINCMIVEMDIEAGVAQTEAMLDTQRMTLLGQGTIDLGEAQLALALRPKAKRKKLSRLAVPVDITGSFAEPEVSPRAGRAVGQAIRGVLGGLLIPLNQLSALFGKETVDACRQALEQIGELPDPPAVGESPS